MYRPANLKSASQSSQLQASRLIIYDKISYLLSDSNLFTDSYLQGILGIDSSSTSTTRLYQLIYQPIPLSTFLVYPQIKAYADTEEVLFQTFLSFENSSKVSANSNIYFDPEARSIIRIAPFVFPNPKSNDSISRSVFVNGIKPDDWDYITTIKRHFGRFGPIVHCDFPQLAAEDGEIIMLGFGIVEFKFYTVDLCCHHFPWIPVIGEVDSLSVMSKVDWMNHCGIFQKAETVGDRETVELYSNENNQKITESFKNINFRDTHIPATELQKILNVATD